MSQFVFVPFRGMSLKTVKSMRGKDGELRLVFVPFRGMSLKTDGELSESKDKLSVSFRPLSGNEFKNLPNLNSMRQMAKQFSSPFGE